MKRRDFIKSTTVLALGAFSSSSIWALSKNGRLRTAHIGVGGMGVVSGFLILSFYAVIAGWSIGYITEAVAGNFAQYNTGASSAEHFNSLVADIPWIVGYFTLFMIITMLFVYLGIQKGIERGSKIMMPILLVLLVVLMIRGITLEGSEEGLAFLLNPDWSKIDAQAILIALGHAFFSLSLGMGTMITYGSYIGKKENLGYEESPINTLLDFNSENFSYPILNPKTLIFSSIFFSPF